MSVQVQHFPAHPPDRDYCLVWTKPDGTQQIFGCDTQDNCQRELPHWQERAGDAERNKRDSL